MRDVMELRQLTMDGTPVPVNEPVEVDDQIVRLGHAIRSTREERNMTVRYVAIKCNVTPAYLRRIERGAARPSLTLLLRLASVLGNDVVTLMNRTVPIPEPMR